MKFGNKDVDAVKFHIQEVYTRLAYYSIKYNSKAYIDSSLSSVKNDYWDIACFDFVKLTAGTKYQVRGLSIGSAPQSCMSESNKSYSGGTLITYEVDESTEYATFVAPIDGYLWMSTFHDTNEYNSVSLYSYTGGVYDVETLVTNGKTHTV